jgi:hypothetical protein
MPYKHNEPRRHRLPQTRYKVSNWRKYNRALQQHSSLTVWVTPEALEAWAPAKLRPAVPVVRTASAHVPQFSARLGLRLHRCPQGDAPWYRANSSDRADLGGAAARRPVVRPPGGTRPGTYHERVEGLPGRAKLRSANPIVSLPLSGSAWKSPASGPPPAPRSRPTVRLSGSRRATGQRSDRLRPPE